jgi:surfactin synthase thioesterase subunit
LLPDDIEMCAVQLPGRETRLADAPVPDVRLLAAMLADELASYLDLPFAFYGHSFGALVAFELAVRLGPAIPLRHLFAAACPAPHLPRPELWIDDLPDEQFITTLRRYGGTPEVVLRDRELMEVLGPTIRADLHAYATYAYEPRPRLACPITAVGGAQDLGVTRRQLDEWHSHTTGRFGVFIVPGNHFFLATSGPAVAERVCELFADRARSMPRTAVAHDES